MLIWKATHSKSLLIFKALSSPDKAQRIHESAHVDKTTAGNSHTPWLQHTHALCACRQLLTLMTYCLVLINSSLFLQNNPLLLPLFNGSRLVLSLLTHSSESFRDWAQHQQMCSETQKMHNNNLSLTSLSIRGLFLLMRVNQTTDIFPSTPLLDFFDSV